MLANLLRAAGVSPALIERGISSADQLRCDLEELKRSLQLEYGRANCELIPHNPAQLPRFAYQELPADQVEVFDGEAALGKAVTRGHVANVGDTELVLNFQGLSGDQWSEDYHLPAGAVLDTASFAWRKARARAVDIAGRVQVLMQ